MSSTNPTAWAAALAQLNTAQPAAEPARPRVNPRPAGVIQPGSATEAVLAYLRERPGLWFAYHQIVAGTGRTAKSVDWALIFLKAGGQIEVTSEARSAQHRRYRAAPALASLHSTSAVHRL